MELAMRAFRIITPPSATASRCVGEPGYLIERQVAKTQLPQFEYQLHPSCFKIGYAVWHPEVMGSPDCIANHINDRQELIGAVFNRHLDALRIHAETP